MTSSLAAWLLRIAGVGHEMASRVDRADLRWARPAVLVAALVLLPVAAWWIARRHRERMPWLSPRQQRILTCCRTAVLAVLALVLAGPSLRLEEQVRQRPVVAFLVDESDSMGLPVGHLPTASIAPVAAAAGFAPADSEEATTAAGERLARLSRRELVRALIDTHDETTLRQLEDRFDVRWYGVARRPWRQHNRSGNDRPLPPGGRRSDTADAAPPETFDTAIGAALEMAMDDAADRSLAAIVLLSDGHSTTGLDPLDAIRRATEASGGTPRAPVLAVPVGSLSSSADIAVTDLLAAPEATIDDTVAITATLQSTGFAGRVVTVELRDAAAQVVESQEVTLRDGRQRVVFSWQADRPGPHVMHVAVPSDAEESVPDNNVVETTIDVTRRTLKTLVVDHAPRWDLRFLDHAIRRDKAFEATVILSSAADTEAAGTGVPEAAADWAGYDLVVIGDMPATALDAERQRGLVEAVASRGVGLVLQPGGAHLPREYVGAPLAALFPVTIDAAAGDGAAVLLATDFKPLQMLVTARGALHPAFALSGDATRNRRRWSEMPPFFLAAAAATPTPAATVLAEVQAPGIREPRPLVVEAPAGNGRVLWIGTDETFRWRRNLGDQLFWRFWGQSLRSVARRSDRPADATWLTVSPARCEPGSPVLVELNLVDSQRQPVAAASHSVTVTGPSTTTVVLQPGGRPGLYAGMFTPESIGRYVVEVVGQRDVSGELLVARPSRERAQPGVDRESLEAIADLSGGAVLEIGDFESLPSRLAARSVEIRETFEDDLWDTWPVLLLLVGLFCVDVGIRRLSGSN